MKNLISSNKSTEVQTSQTDRPSFVEHQAIEIAGNDGKTHQIWSRTAQDAFREATKWSYRHDGLYDVRLMILRDENEGCWDRAKRVSISRQCNLQLIAQRETANLNTVNTNTAKP